MRVALTGAGGFTGRYVAQALSKAGATCVPLEVELTDPRAVARAVETAKFDRIIHLAAKAFVAADSWTDFYTVNQIGTMTLLDAVARTHPGVRCVMASSAQIYGPSAAGLIAEDAPPNPANHYAVSKHAAEQSAALWRDRLDVVIARPFNYTGVGQESRYLIPKIVDHFRRRVPIIELGNVWVQRDFGDVRSVADAYVGLALAPQVPGLVNIATGVVRSIDDILSILTTLSNHHPRVRINPAFVRANDVPVLGGDASRLREALPDWRPQDFVDTLAWMYQQV